MSEVTPISTNFDSETGASDVVMISSEMLHAWVNYDPPEISITQPPLAREAAIARQAFYSGWLAKEVFDGNENYIDEDGTVWERPTAWAYAAATRALEKKRQEIDELREALAPFLRACEFARVGDYPVNIGNDDVILGSDLLELDIVAARDAYACHKEQSDGAG